MGNLKTVKEITKIYNVTDMAVRHWLKKGLPFKIEKKIGIRPRKVIDIKEVEEFLKIGIRK